MAENEIDQNADPETGQATEAMKTERVSVGCDKPDQKDERHERIKDYLRTALAMEDPLAGNVGAVNSDLMLFGHRLQQAITKALEMTPTALDEFGRLMPAIDSYMFEWKVQGDGELLLVSSNGSAWKTGDEGQAESKIPHWLILDAYSLACLAATGYTPGMSVGPCSAR